jgi:hypothetical protein
MADMVVAHTLTDSPQRLPSDITHLLFVAVPHTQHGVGSVLSSLLVFRVGGLDHALGLFCTVEAFRELGAEHKRIPLTPTSTHSVRSPSYVDLEQREYRFSH